MRAIVFSESIDVAFQMSSKAKELGFDVNVLVLSNNSKLNEFIRHGADRVYKFTNWNKNYDILSLIENLFNKIGGDVIFIGSTKLGKEIAPRLAQRINASCVTDVQDIWMSNTELFVKRYNLGGRTIAIIKILKMPSVISIIPGSFEIRDYETSGEFIEFNPEIQKSGMEIIEVREKKKEAVDLRESDVIICVGRGIKKKEDISLIKELAEKLSAEIGCTRPLSHEYGWFTEERMIGLSGVKVRPTLLISIGVSGQIQHVVGIVNSKVIVAINKDPNAPIFENADYGIVGDLYQVVPKIIEIFKKPQ